MRLVDMKAWQLYVGHSFFIVLIGLFFWLLFNLLSALGLKNKTLTSGLHGIENLATGQVTADTGINYIKSVM